MKKSLLSYKAIILPVLLVFSLSCHHEENWADDGSSQGLTLGSSQGITFTFTDSSISASKSSDTYIIDGTKLTIKHEGKYTVQGQCSNGSITIQKETADVVLTLDSITFSCDYSAPVTCEEKTKVTIILNGSSTLTDKENPADEGSDDKTKADAFEGACIKAKSNSVLTIKGDGTINVDASKCKDGIKGLSEADLRIESGTINVNAAKKGISSSGSLIISDGNVNVEAADNGIESDPYYELDDIDRKTASFAGGTVTISGGDITVSAEDKAIKAASRLEVGIRGSDSGPRINVIRSYEGMEAAQVFCYSGDVTIRSNDDGINAAYDRFMNPDEFNGGYQYAYDLYARFKEQFGDFLIEIDGGTWYVNADGDGLDSNGSININGGNITLFGSEGNDDAAIDYETVFEMNDGQILAIGTENMAAYPTRTAEAKSYVVFGSKGQWDPSIYPVNPDISIKSGDKIVIKDSENNVAARTTAVKTANCVMFALTDKDKTYGLYINDERIQ